MPDSNFVSILAEHGLKFPPPPKPAGFYRPFLRMEDWGFLSGQISREADGKLVTGKVGKDLTVEQGQKAAQWALLQALSLLESEGGLPQIKQVVRLVGYVQSADNFYHQSDIMNPASELLVKILGEKGRHVRTSIGAVSLPLNAAVEVELTVRFQS